MSGIQMLESRLDSKWSGLGMPSKVWTQSPDFGQFHIKKQDKMSGFPVGLVLSKESYPNRAIHK